MADPDRNADRIGTLREDMSELRRTLREEIQAARATMRKTRKVGAKWAFRVLLAILGFTFTTIGGLIIALLT